MLITVAGAAGSGKSTLGRTLARELGVALLDLDTLTNPLLDGAFAPLLGDTHWNDPALRDTVRPARYAVLRAAIADQVSAGDGAVAVAPFTAELAGGEAWDRLVEACGEEPCVVWITADPELLARRRAGRAVDRDAHAMDAPIDPPRVPHLRIDAALTTAQQLNRVLRHLGMHRVIPADSPVLSKTFRAGLFDLDGTLVDSTAAVHRSWSLLAEEYGMGMDLLEAGHGQPAEAHIRARFPADQADAALARISAIEADDVSDVVTIPGSHEFFMSVPRRAIVTSGTRLIARSRLTAADVPRPDVVITFDDVVRGKPDPEPFLLAAERIGVEARDCIVFEDAPAGIAAARAAGCAVVAITGTHDADELRGADLIVDRLDQLAVTVVGAGDAFTLSVRD